MTKDLQCQATGLQKRNNFVKNLAARVLTERAEWIIIE